ncbi:MAG: hypothetical protein ACO1OC_01460 [Tuberibacillus sp.]
MINLFVPALIIVLLLTFFLPNLKQVELEKRLFSKTYRRLRWLNIICSFIILAPTIITPLLVKLDDLGGWMMDKGWTKHFWGDLWCILGLEALHFLLFIAVGAIIPLTQWILKKYLPNVFDIPAMKNVAGKLVVKK